MDTPKLLVVMQLILNILHNHMIIVLLALSISMNYYLLKNFNIAQAVVITFGAYLSYLLLYSFHQPLYIAIIIAIILSVSIGLLSELFIFKQMRNRKLPSFAFLVASIGLYTILQNCISLYFGDDTKSLNIGEIAVGHQIFGAYITTVQIFTIAVSAFVFIGMYLLYNYTTLGKQIRAVSENAEFATIYGISSNKIILIVTAVSSALAAIAGILYAYDTNLTPTMGFNLLLYGIVAMIIGGVGSFRGLLLGSLLLASAQNLVAYYLDTKWMDAATYIILIAFLLWKPLGFSGKKLKKVEI
ncbi:MAG: branched-chain amino acid ABC transporter permease [Chitinophagales bacterium]|nr:branched-chain amino acid ABC transporter permease [Chitinophagales bacterium]